MELKIYKYLSNKIKLINTQETHRRFIIYLNNLDKKFLRNLFNLIFISLMLWAEPIILKLFFLKNSDLNSLLFADI